MVHYKIRFSACDAFGTAEWFNSMARPKGEPTRQITFRLPLKTWEKMEKEMAYRAERHFHLPLGLGYSPTELLSKAMEFYLDHHAINPEVRCPLVHPSTDSLL